MHLSRLWPLLLALLTSCALFDRVELTPAYVQVDSFRLYDTTGTRLIEDQEITEVWAFMDGIYIGTFGLPARFPVPVTNNDQRTLKLFAGVHADRIEQQRVQYPYYDPDTSLVGLRPGQNYVVNVTGVAKARLSPRQLQIPPRFEATFEDEATSGMRSIYPSFDPSTPNLLNIVAFEPDVAKPLGGGQRYALVNGRDGDTTNLSILQTVPIAVPSSKPLYLEAWYRSSHAFSVGIYISNSTNASQKDLYYGLDLNPSSTWKKVYVYLFEEVDAVNSSNLNNGTSYDQMQVVFTSYSPGSASDFLAVDNVRLMEYK